MNFNPFPSMDDAEGGIVPPVVRSWNDLLLNLEKYSRVGVSPSMRRAL